MDDPDIKHYCFDPMQPFPKKWRDRLGPMTVMCEPIKGYVMVRRPGGVPFVLHAAQLCNAEKHPVHGPFEMLAKTKRIRVINLSAPAPADTGER